MTALLTNTTSQYTDDDRREVIAQYVVLGNAKRVSEITKPPHRTVSDWIKSDWGQKLLAQIRLEKADELDSQLTASIHSAIKSVSDRVEFGEPMVDKQTGEPIVVTNKATGEPEQARMPVACQALATTAGILFDKRQISRNLPTQISAKSDTEALMALKKQFEALAGRTIEGEVVD